MVSEESTSANRKSDGIDIYGITMRTSTLMMLQMTSRPQTCRDLQARFIELLAEFREVEPAHDVGPFIPPAADGHVDTDCVKSGNICLAALNCIREPNDPFRFRILKIAESISNSASSHRSDEPGE